MKIRTFTELSRLPTFEERFEYVKLNGSVGTDTFGHDRYLNQMFYQSKNWRDLRNHIIVRDNGCDLGIEDRIIGGKIYIHHLNPITLDDLLNETDALMNPEFLICVSGLTHNAIHYGDANLLPNNPVERKPNDTCPWKKG